MHVPGSKRRERRYWEIVLLFHTPVIVKVLGVVGLSFRLSM